MLTSLKNNNNENIVVPIEIEADMHLGKNLIKINRVKTVFGYEISNVRDLNDFIKYNIENNIFEKVYESKKELSTGFSTVVNSNNIRSQNAEKVNYVNTDNKGRQLTQEQQEYFKDSKARNDNGELEVYTTVKPE